MDNLGIYVLLSLELLTAILAAFYYNKHKTNSAKWLFIVFLYTAVNEIAMSLLKEVDLFVNNNLYYNIYDVFIFTALPFVFRAHIKSQKSRVLVKVFVVLFLISVFINSFFESFTNSKLNVAFSLGGVLLIITIVCYFIDLLSNSNLELLSKKLLVYIGAGYLIFQVCFIPLDLVRFLMSNGLGDFYNAIYNFRVFIIVLTYLIFSIGYITCYKNNSIKV